MRKAVRLLRHPVGVRAAHVRARGGCGRPHRRGVHARLLPTRAGPLSRADGDEAVARDAQEPEAAEAARALPERQRQALLPARHRAPGPAIQTRPGVLTDERVGEIYLPAEDIQARIEELGAEIGADYDGREPILVASLKTAVVFVSDLSRALPIVHNLDFIALAGYEGNGVNGRDVLLVEDIVDTGLTLNYVAKTLLLREPASLAAVTLLDRPYRRLCEDVPVRYVGFTVPDEFFVGYGFDLQERYRNLSDLHVLRGES